MVQLGRKPIRLAYYGDTKIGKSHLAAMFVKDLDGVYCDLGKVCQVSSLGKGGPAPRYTVTDVGDAATACENVGLSPDQYKFVNTWEGFLEVIEYAKMYRDSALKENHRIWFVVDDTYNWRYLCAYYCMIQNGHKSMSTPDWASATMNMSSAFQELESNFNCIFVNQLCDEYKGDNKTGNRVAAMYPGNLPYLTDANLEYTIAVREDGSKYPILKIDSLKSIWVCNKDRPASVIFEEPDKIAPKTILKTLGFDESLW
jgi:hypothetical protein